MILNQMIITVYYLILSSMGVIKQNIFLDFFFLFPTRVTDKDPVFDRFVSRSINFFTKKKVISNVLDNFYGVIKLYFGLFFKVGSSPSGFFGG